MAEEAQEIEQVETPASLQASLAEFQKSLDATPEVEEEVEETAQADGVEHSAEGDSVDDAPAEEVAEVADEGPSFLMKQEAARMGIPPQLVEFCRDDRQLQDLIGMAGAAPANDTQQSAPEMEVESPYQFTLPEDEYGPDDPVAKQIRSIVDQLNKTHNDSRRKDAEIEELKGQVQAKANAEAYDALYSTFDSELDALQSPRFGNKSVGLTEKQTIERYQVAQRYCGLGAEDRTPDAQKRRLVNLALEAYAPEVVEQRNKKQQASAQQKRQVIGGAGAQRTVQPAKTTKDIYAEWNKSIRTGAPLPN